MRLHVFYLASFLMMAFSVSAANNAENRYIIKGIVVDSLTNEPIPFATIRMTLSDDVSAEMLSHSVCDIDGKFRIETDQPGTYYFTLQFVGKAPAVKRITLPENRREYDAGMLYMQDGNLQLNEITVVAQKPLVKIEIDKLVYSIADDPEANVMNTLEMMRKVPMVTVDGQDNIQLKGSSDFKIYVNGRPSSLMNNNPSEVLKSMPAYTVKNIEVITDPGARYDAEGVGGIINIVTSRSMFDGYTGTINTSGSYLKEYTIGSFLTAKSGRFGITANYEYQYEDEPWASSESVRENLSTDVNRYLNQTGRTKEKGNMHHGYLEASFEFDTLNLISVGGDLFRRKEDLFTEYAVIMRNLSQDPVYSYNRHSRSKPVFGTSEINVDYQHATQKKGELLTLSYRFSNSPHDDENHTDILDAVNYDLFRQWEMNKAKTNEHTGQLDYVLPTMEGQEMEVGAKYILRISDSDIQQYVLDDSTNHWMDIADDERKFKHTQHIYSGYAGYTMKLNRFGIKGGLRAEGTSLRVKYDYASGRNFETDYFDLVPNTTLSFKISDEQQVRIGYNMRIQRASIYHLNPYVNTTDPLNISYGNPNLKSVKSNGINLNYSFFTRNFSMNATLSHSFINNSIERYTFMDPEQPGVAVTTYGNIGKKQQTGMYLYANWNPIQNLRIFINASGNYTDLESKESGLTNSGWSGRIFGGAQASLPKDFRLNLNYGLISPSIQLQGKHSSFSLFSMTLNKDFFNKKITVSLECNTPFKKYRKMETNSSDPTFTMRTTEYHRSRDFGITLSYRFGNLKEQIRKVTRSIVNDDQLNGSSYGN